MPTFTTSFSKPAILLGLILTPDEATSRMDVLWTASVDANFYEYRVHRAGLSGIFSRVDQGDLLTIGTPHFVDHWAPVLIPVSYRVTQHNGAIESDPLSGSSQIPNGSFWVGIPGDSVHTLEFPLGSDFSVTPYLDQEVHRPLGRRTALPVGEESGLPDVVISFTLDPESRGLFDLLLEIGDQIRSGLVDHAFAKSPHGDSWKIALGPIQRTLLRAGYEKISFPGYTVEE